MNIFGGVFDADKLTLRHLELQELSQDPDLWNNPDSAKKIQVEQKTLDLTLVPLNQAKRLCDDIETLCDLYLEEPFEDFESEALSIANHIETLFKELEFKRMFTSEFDSGNAFIEIQSGSGGTEAQDWAQMLWRMYKRWIEKKEFNIEITDLAQGDVAGIKGLSAKISGPYAYGLLRTESGVHRLVRKSPFDSGNRRHTSFAAVFITPELDDTIDITISTADLRVDTYRASGAGGQHVNRTDSAVRITHLPTGIVVQCQNDRSQLKNRSQAMAQLKAKLYKLEQQKQQDRADELNDQKSDITWGAQVRNYILDDQRIKDLRSGLETGNTTAMLDGELLDKFIEASLLKGV